MKSKTLLTIQLSVTLCMLFGVWSAGCMDKLEGVPCVEDVDCGDGFCMDGNCVSTISLSDDSASDDEFLTGTDDAATEYSLSMKAVDILLVVDNTGSMIQEQQILTTSIFNLINNITEQMIGAVGPVTDALDIRVAVTTTDMGVSFDGTPYTEYFSAHTICSAGSGFGNDGTMLTTYEGDSFSVVDSNEIFCSKSDNACPPDWFCANINADGIGICTPPNADEMIVCPQLEAFLAEDTYLVPDNGITDSFGYGYRDFVASAACLSNVGTDGCAFEQQLSAVPAAFTKHGQEIFLRPDALTVILVVSDEDDCSLATDEWHEVDELDTNARNIACGLHPDMMMSVDVLKQQIIDAKTTATGVTANGSLIFAAITGVPPVPACQGIGSALNACGDVALEYGTMDFPAVIERPDPNGNSALYYEYACERFDANGSAITQAYPARRIVEMARQFGNFGYIYSICNEDWTPAMNQLSNVITARLTL